MGGGAFSSERDVWISASGECMVPKDEWVGRTAGGVHH